MDGAYGGVLAVEDGCVYLDSPDGGQLDTVIWPAGTTFDPSARTLTLADGRAFADGDLILLTGGSVDIEQLPVAAAPASAEALACLSRTNDDGKIFLVDAAPAYAVQSVSTLP